MNKQREIVYVDSVGNAQRCFGLWLRFRGGEHTSGNGAMGLKGISLVLTDRDQMRDKTYQEEGVG